MKKFIRYIVKNWFWIIAGLITTKAAVEKCYEQRGGFYIGGEWLVLPVVLMLSYLIPEIVKTMFDAFGEEDKDAGTVIGSRRGVEIQRSVHIRRGGR